MGSRHEAGNDGKIKGDAPHGNPALTRGGQAGGMNELTLALLSVFPLLVIVGGLHDLLTMKIPNWVSIALVVAFFPAALAVGLPLSAIGVCVGVAFAALIVGMGLFAMRWIGGGDAKLMAASCLWLGLTGSGMFVLWTAVVGGGFCLLMIAARNTLQPLAVGAPAWVGRLLEPKGDIPYGVAIALGALMAYADGLLATTFIAGG